MTQLDGILARLEPVLGAAREPPVALDGGITNRNYRLRLGDGEYVVRLPGHDTGLLGISREAERMACEAAAALNIGPAVVALDDESLVTAFIHAPPLDAEQLKENPEPVARAVRAFHDSGVTLPTRFDVADLMDHYAAILKARGGTLPEEYSTTQTNLRQLLDAAPKSAPVPCHNDLLAGNLMLTESGAMIVDWEYAGMGQAMFDLGNLAVNNGFDRDAERRLLSAYDGTPPTPQRHAELRLWRMVSDAREAAWGVVQTVLSELDFDFGAYAEQHFARFRAAFDTESEECLRATAP